MRRMSPCSARMPTKKLPPMITRAHSIPRFRSVVSFSIWSGIDSERLSDLTDGDRGDAGDDPGTSSSKDVELGSGLKEDALSIADSQRSVMINGAVLFLGDRGRGGGDPWGCIGLIRIDDAGCHSSGLRCDADAAPLRRQRRGRACGCNRGGEHRQVEEI